MEKVQLIQNYKEYLGSNYSDTEIVIGLVGAVGTRLDKVSEEIINRLENYNYKATPIKISKEVIPLIKETPNINKTDEAERINTHMNLGNEARFSSGDNSILALGAAAIINGIRKKNEAKENRLPNCAFIINSLKHPAEASILRDLYSKGFYLIGVYEDKEKRLKYLNEDKRIEPLIAKGIIERDEAENLEYGQKTSDTFHLSDFLIHFTDDYDKWKKNLCRILDLILGYPYITPTFDEYAMFMAFSASLRSADLSRQVGASIANKRSEIISTGANDCPKFGFEVFIGLHIIKNEKIY